MLRDPLAFVWRYALGWRVVPDDDQPLTLDARAYGELVHELLKRTVDALEPVPGYARASRQEIEAALAKGPRRGPKPPEGEGEDEEVVVEDEAA